MVADEAGEIIALGRRFEEDLLLVDLEVGRGEDPRSPVAPPTRIVSLPVRDLPRPMLPASRPRSWRRWMKSTGRSFSASATNARKNGFKRVVIGLSGGIDSALTACLAVEALGPDNVIGVTMPSR